MPNTPTPDPEPRTTFVPDIVILCRKRALRRRLAHHIHEIAKQAAHGDPNTLRALLREMTEIVEAL